MFDLLKSKIAGFINNLAGKKKEEQEAPSARQAEEQKAKETISTHLKQDERQEAKASPKQAEEQKITQSVKSEEQKPQHPSFNLDRLESKASSKRQLEPKLSISTTIKSIFSDEITLSQQEISDLADELELSLLEADVEYGVSSEISAQLKAKLANLRIPKGQIGAKTKQTIAEVLQAVMTSDRKFDLVQRVKALPKPAKILFVGPNGAGKTTTMAKIAKKLMDAGLSVVFSASDTFRAAAIEQTEAHASKLGIKAIKNKYGSDPAAVAFDAINFAKAHNIDVVLIDSAGRQDTNVNLLSELKKIVRIAKPDIKIYVGESIGGNAMIEQIRAFDQAIGIDGAILTKLDCDAKGGTAISVVKATGIPILFVGVGQSYSDLIDFDPSKIAKEIMN
ncbi:MAG: signal recognition particle-docking protein FtsY [Candidatus Anstonellaceae archaeon]